MQFNASLLLLGAGLLFASAAQPHVPHKLPRLENFRAHAKPAIAETVGGGTVQSPAIGPPPSFGLGGANMALVKNWHFGAHRHDQKLRGHECELCLP